MASTSFSGDNVVSEQGVLKLPGQFYRALGGRRTTRKNMELSWSGM